MMIVPYFVIAIAIAIVIVIVIATRRC